MKKFIVLIAGALFTLSVQAKFIDGVYQGEGKGNHGAITVEVQVKGGKISGIKVLKHTETEMIIQAPIDNMLPEIIEKNGMDGVDEIAGATNSSKGIKEAVKNALEKAR